MQIKFVEIRDEGTCIAAMIMKVVGGDPVAQLFLDREGYPKDGSAVILMRLGDQQANVDPYGWPGNQRTVPNAHRWCYEHFDEIVSGQVVDVRMILGEAIAPADAEIVRAA